MVLEARKCINHAVQWRHGAHATAIEHMQQRSLTQHVATQRSSCLQRAYINLFSACAVRKKPQVSISHLRTGLIRLPGQHVPERLAAAQHMLQRLRREAQQAGHQRGGRRLPQKALAPHDGYQGGRQPICNGIAGPPPRLAECRVPKDPPQQGILCIRALQSAGASSSEVPMCRQSGTPHVCSRQGQ